MKDIFENEFRDREEGSSRKEVKTISYFWDRFELKEELMENKRQNTGHDNGNNSKDSGEGSASRLLPGQDSPCEEMVKEEILESEDGRGRE